VLGPEHRLARNETELVRDVNLERVGMELFGWAILAAAVAIAADWIVANRFYAPRAEPPQATDVVAEFDGLPDDEEEESVQAGVGTEPPPLPRGDRA
jgi:hypothetical protein